MGGSPVRRSRAIPLLLPAAQTPKLVVSRAPDTLFQPFEEPLQVTSAALAVRKGDADVLNFLDSWIAFQREGNWLADRQNYALESRIPLSPGSIGNENRRVAREAR